MEYFKEITDKIITEIGAMIAEYGLKVILAIILFLVGLFIIKRVMKVVTVAFEKSKVDVSLTKFLTSATSLILKVVLAMTIIQVLDIPTASLVAIIGAAGLGIGFALQGTLSNLAGGVLILTLRPFSVGDYIEDGSGNEGFVEDIQVFYTTLLTHDHKTVIIPNGDISNSSITNYTRQAYRRVDMFFGVDYSADIHLVKQTIRKVVDAHPLIVKKDETVVKISKHGDSAVVYMVLVWCKPNDYLPVKYDVIESVKIAFDEAGVSIPYPHMDVNIISDQRN